MLLCLCRVSLFTTRDSGVYRHLCFSFQPLKAFSLLSLFFRPARHSFFSLSSPPRVPFVARHFLLSVAFFGFFGPKGGVVLPRFPRPPWTLNNVFLQPQPSVVSVNFFHLCQMIFLYAVSCFVAAVPRPLLDGSCSPKSSNSFLNFFLCLALSCPRAPIPLCVGTSPPFLPVRDHFFEPMARYWRCFLVFSAVFFCLYDGLAASIPVHPTCCPSLGSHPVIGLPVMLNFSWFPFLLFFLLFVVSVFNFVQGVACY